MSNLVKCKDCVHLISCVPYNKSEWYCVKLDKVVQVVPNFGVTPEAELDRSCIYFRNIYVNSMIFGYDHGC